MMPRASVMRHQSSADRHVRTQAGLPNKLFFSVTEVPNHSCLKNENESARQNCPDKLIRQPKCQYCVIFAKSAMQNSNPSCPGSSFSCLRPLSMHAARADRNDFHMFFDAKMVIHLQQTDDRRGRRTRAKPGLFFLFLSSFKIPHGKVKIGREKQIIIINK